MSGGGTTSTNTVQNSDPWSGAQPYLTDLMSQAQGLYKQGSSYAPFSTYAPPSPTTSLGLQLTQDRALNGSPTMTAANNSLQQLMQSQTAPGSSTLQSLLSGYSDPGAALTQQGGTMQNAALPLLNSQLNQTNAATGMATSLANTGPQLSGNSTLQSGANGQMNNSADPLAAFYATQNPNANPANRYLSSEAATTSINPYLDSMFSAASKPVINAINAQFAQGGRTGSAANQSVLTQDLGNMASTMYGQNYNQAVQNQQNAANSIQSAYDNGANRNLSATSLLGNLSGQDISNRLNSAQNLNAGNISAYNAQGNAASLLGSLSGQDLARNNAIAGQIGNLSESQAQRLLASGNQLSSDAFNQAGVKANAANNLNSQFNTQNQQQLAATALSPTLANQDYTDLQNLLNVGGAYDTQANNQIQDLLSRYNYGQQQPWNLLQNYAGVVNGMGSLGGSITSKGTVPNNSNTSLIGGGLGLLGSALPYILGSGATAGAAGAGSSAGMAALGALAMSDRSAKTDIKRIGTYPNGLPKYSFRYHGSDVSHIGLMADDVERVRPAAVMKTALGLKAVYYDLALAA